MVVQRQPAGTTAWRRAPPRSKIGAKLQEDTVLVVTVGAATTAGAQIQIQIVVQRVAQAGSVDGAGVGHGELAVGGEQGMVVAEAVGHFCLQAGPQERPTHFQGGGVVGEGASLETGQLVGAAPTQGGLHRHGQPFPLLAGQQQQAAADTPFTAILAKEQHSGAGVAAQAAATGPPVQGAAQFRSAGIVTTQQQRQVGSGPQTGTAEAEVTG